MIDGTKESMPKTRTVYDAGKKQDGTDSPGELRREESLIKTTSSSWDINTLHGEWRTECASRSQSLRQSMPETITNVTSVFSMVMGVVVLVGWLLDIPLLKSISPEWGNMKANTAACFILAGASLWILREENIPRPSRFLAMSFAALITVVGVLTLTEYAFQKDFGIDQLLFEEVLKAGDLSPGRMAAAAAASFVFIGLALLGLDWKNQRGNRLSQSLPLAVAVISLFSVMGYLYEAKTLYRAYSYFTPMAAHTAVSFVALSLGVLCLRFERSPIGSLMGAGVGSQMARWLLPIAFGIPMLLGWLWLQGEQAGIYGSEVQSTLLTTSLVVILVAFVWRVTGSLNREETERHIIRKQAEETLLKASALQSAIFNSANFSSIATDAKGVIQIFNVGAERMLGYTAAEVVNKITPADISDPQELIARAEDLSVELGTPITPGFEALVFKASRGIEDIYELTYIRKDSSRFPAVVSVTALRDDQDAIIGYLLIGTDNTARQQADDNLRIASQYARSLIEASLDPLVTISSEGKITDVNAGSVKVTGVPRDKLIGTDFSNYFTEPDKARDGYQQAFSKGSVTDYPLTLRHEDGSLTEVLYNASVYKDVQGNVLGVFAAARDITARKRAEEALLEAGALQDAIFNSANFSSIATDAKGVIQIFNVGAERMLGYTAAEVVNKITPAEISDPQELIARAEELSVELDTPITPGFEALVFKASRGIEDIYELTYIRKDGSHFPAVVSVTALRDPENAIIGYLLIGTDNSVGKQIEAEQEELDQRLRDQQFYTRSLIESNIDALMTTDPKGIITDVNKQMEALTGCTRDELIGAPFKGYFTDPERAETGIKLVLSEKKVTNYELTARARDGRETVVSYNATTFYDRARKLQGVFAAAREMTELKRFERALQEKNVELENATRMKSEFLATMSHELRTPLNAIIGFSEVLRDGLVGPLIDVQREYISDIFTSGQHLLALINDILDLSKVEVGMMTLALELVDVESLLSDSLSIIKEKAAAHNIRLELENGVDFGEPHLDVRKTKQIIYNLLANAVKFTPDGGHVTMRARRVPRSTVGLLPGTWSVHSLPLADSEYNEFIELCVSDNGIGISEENMKKLFLPFTQIDSRLARKFEGTGLGLSLVRQMVELHGGTVAVASTEDEGSSFAAWLPLRGPLEAATTLPQSNSALAMVAAEPSGRIALVVEDDNHAAELIRLLLEVEGFTILRATTGEAGLLLAAQHALSLITLDLILPGMDGWEFLQRIRENSTLAQVPVVIMSILGDSNRHFGLSSGAAAVLQKPVSREQLHVALKQLGQHPVPGEKRTVLVVDDDPRAVELIATFLPAPDYEVVRAYGGSEAIALAQQRRPDLIVLALMMPEVSGFDVVDTLRGDADTARIPILVVTSKEVTVQDHAALNSNQGPVIPIIDKAGLDRLHFIAEVRRALPPNSPPH